MRFADLLLAFLCGAIGLGLPIGFLWGYWLRVYVYRHYDHDLKGGTKDP